MTKKTDIILDINEDTTTGEIAISGEPEANMPPPVPASHHVAEWTYGTIPVRKEMTALPYIATALAATVLSATLLIVGIIIGAGL